MKLSVDIKKKLKNFTLTAQFQQEEERLALLGESGAGKTLLLKCIAGLEKPDEGKIVLGGRILFDSEKGIHLPPQKRNVGYLFQDYALFPHMTVLKNIQITAKDKNEAFHWIKQLGLSGKENDYPKTLSGGEKQRTALARLLCAKPDLLLLDEPFSALDKLRKSSLEGLLLELIESKKYPAVLVTHDRSEAYRFAKKIAVMDRGILIPPAEKHDFFENPRSLAAVKLTGCQNTTRLIWEGGHCARAMDWGISLRIEKKGLNGKAQYAAYREQNFSLANAPEKENVFEGCVKRIIEDTFSYLVYFSQKGSDNLLCWEVQKNDWQDFEPLVKKGLLFAKIHPEKLLLLES